MTLKLRLYLAGIALAGLSACAAMLYHRGAENALLKQRLHASDSTIVALKGRAAMVDIRYVRDTLWMTKVTRRYDSIVTKWDTVSVPVAPETVRVIVAAGVQSLNACSAVVLTCEQRVAQRDSIIATLEKQRPLLIGNKPSRTKSLLITTAKIGGGAAIGYLAARVK